MKQLALGAIAFTLASVAWSPRAGAYGDAANPLVYNNDPDAAGDPQGQRTKYVPKDVRKPSVVLANDVHVFVAAAQSRDTYGKGPRCMVATTDPRSAGDCTAPEDLVIAELAMGRFKLKTAGDPSRCLDVADGARLIAKTGRDTQIDRPTWKLVATACATASVATIDFKGRTDGPEGSSYDRNLLTLTNGTGTYYVYFGQSPYAKTGAWSFEPKGELDLRVVKSDDSEAANLKNVRAGIALTGCRAGACGYASLDVDKPSAVLSSIVGYLALSPSVLIAKLGDEAPKPNVVFFFVDTLRADAVNETLMPHVMGAFGIDKLPFDRSISGASATQQSTYSLLNMRPGFEREWIIRERKADPAGQTFGNGGLATAIFKRLGYHVVLFSRPDWFDTFVFTPGTKLQADDESYSTRYSLELPMPSSFDFGAAAAKSAKDLKDLAAGDPALTTLTTKISKAELGKLTYEDHDFLTLAAFKKYLAANKDQIKRGGYVFFVYLSSVHTAQIPDGRADLNGHLIPNADRTFKNDLATSADIDLGGKSPRDFYDEVLADPGTVPQKLASSYYNHVETADVLFGEAYNAYTVLGAGDFYLAFMGDHGESLWENGHSLHGHRPAQKSIEAPILIAKVKGDTGAATLVPTWLDGETKTTAAQMDIFPALFRSMFGADILTKWGLEPYLYTAQFRDGCHLSAEPNRSEDPRRFAIYDSKNGAKGVFFAPSGAMESEKIYTTNLTDYWDNPAPSGDSYAKLKRCFDRLVVDGYTLVDER